MFTRMKTFSRSYMVQFTKTQIHFHRYILFDFTVANRSMTSLKLIISKISISILRSAKLLRRSCPIEARKYYKISFSLLKDRSQPAIDTATVRRIRREMMRNDDLELNDAVIFFLSLQQHASKGHASVILRA